MRYLSLIPLVFLMVACGGSTDSTTDPSTEADSATMRVIDPDAVANEDLTQLDSVKLDIDSSVQVSGTPEVIDDGKVSVDEPCNDVHRREIASKRKTIAELKEILTEVADDPETVADIKSEMEEVQADLDATIERHKCE